VHTNNKTKLWQKQMEMPCRFRNTAFPVFGLQQAGSLRRRREKGKMIVMLKIIRILRLHGWQSKLKAQEQEGENADC